ncbi:putative disease resistance RPP13-like protein 1 [Carya illinoinensis]|uniref:putative disease resistance RPP13-like protein 1 n=1 Tax=Carya illinoinensis TaxID=32201 RepID=UPI001C72854B|nr:putative disease resistance RPP13-like protein 1 [Carya illinoinensis]
MAEVGLAFLSASLSVLFDRIASREVLNFMQGRKPTEVLLWKLKNAMRSVNAVLEDAEEKQLTDSDVKDWVDELKDVIYDAEDIFDGIATEALQSNLQDAESPTRVETFLDYISKPFREPAPFSGKVDQKIEEVFEKVDKKIEEVLDRLEDLTKQKDCMGLQVGVREKQHPERSSTSYISESDTFGRNEDKKKVIDFLLSSDVSGNEMCVIAIVGMGGIGKTTLAQLAYNDSLVEQRFNLNVWFCVSEEFDELKVEKSIIEAATLLPCPKFENPEQLQVILKENLTRKKFLLVLDDVWSEKPRHQEFLSQLLHYGTRGSKILVTTRNESVALAMKATATHHLKLLPNDDCWSLFAKHAFRDGSSNVDPEIKDIGRQIVKKCKGLPLAIKAIGDLLWSESNVERWTNILKSNLWDLHMKGTNILPALRLSYKYLPSYLKRCFAYCSIFSKDYIFKKDELVLLWMAEGLLQQSEIETMEEVGNRYFDALVLRSLFQQSLETKSGFVMHDLVNDLANFVTGQFGFTRLEGDSSKEMGKMTRYLSYFGGSSDSFKKNIEKDLYENKQLRTFLVLDSDEWSEIKMPRARCLKILSLSGMMQLTELPDSISKMKHLRYLDFSVTDINRLPNSICMLYNLQTLKLSCCRKLERLPRDMRKLIHLRHLEIDETDKLKEMPIQMGRLECLQTLSKFVVSKHDSGPSNIGELGKLINLRGKILIQQLQNVRLADDALNASLKDKRYLEELVLQWNPPEVLDISESQVGVIENLQSHEKSEEVLGISESQIGVIKNLQSHEKLKSLTIDCYGGSGFPDWIGLRLPSLSRLNLIDCKCCSALPPLGQLPSLNELYIDGLDGVVTVGPEFYINSCSFRNPFGSLKLLKLKNMENWKDWFHWNVQNEVNTYFQLEELYIENCPKLRGRLPVHLPSLKKLEIYDCQLLKDLLSIKYFPVLTPKEITGFDNLESNPLPDQRKHDGKVDFNSCLQELRIYRCSLLVSLLKEGLLSTLKVLVIDDCNKLELPMQGDHTSLEALELVNSPDSLVFFPLYRFPNLTNVKISSFRNLVSLDKEEFQHLTSLLQLEIKDCPMLRYMPEKGFPDSLRFLQIWNCPVLEEELKRKEGEERLKVARVPKIIIDDTELIQGDDTFPASRSPYDQFGPMVMESSDMVPDESDRESDNCIVKLVDDGIVDFNNCLQELRIYRCSSLMSLLNKGLFSTLKVLVINDCNKLELLPMHGYHPSLKALELVNSHDSLVSFPLYIFPNLINVKISSFRNLISLDKEGFQYLTSLLQLEIKDCPKLRCMPEEGFPTSLHLLEIENCDSVLKEELERKEGEEWLKVARVPNIIIGFQRIQGDKYSPASRSPYDQLGSRYAQDCTDSDCSLM